MKSITRSKSSGGGAKAVNNVEGIKDFICVIQYHHER